MAIKCSGIKVLEDEVLRFMTFLLGKCLYLVGPIGCRGYSKILVQSAGLYSCQATSPVPIEYVPR